MAYLKKKGKNLKKIVTAAHTEGAANRCKFKQNLLNQNFKRFIEINVN